MVIQLLWGFLLTALRCWHYRWTAIAILHVCIFYRSEFCMYAYSIDLNSACMHVCSKDLNSGPLVFEASLLISKLCFYHLTSGVEF